MPVLARTVGADYRDPVVVTDGPSHLYLFGIYRGTSKDGLPEKVRVVPAMVGQELSFSLGERGHFE